jgi:hypothetical protein
MSDGPEIVLDEGRQRIADGEAGAAAHVVVVEENRKQPDVVARRFHLLVVVGPDLARRILDRVGDAAVELDQLEGVDLLWLAVFRHLEVALLHVPDRVALLVRDDDVDANVIDAGAKDRRRLRRIRRGLRRRRLLSGGCCAGGCWAWPAAPSTSSRAAAAEVIVRIRLAIPNLRRFSARWSLPPDQAARPEMVTFAVETTRDDAAFRTAGAALDEAFRRRAAVPGQRL